MTNGINFYSTYILEFLKKKSSVCVSDVCAQAARGYSRRRDVNVFIIPRCQLVEGMQRQCADCLATVFSVISKSCTFVTLGQIT